METVTFHKLHSAGNDFIFVFTDNDFKVNNFLISELCSRNYGIGADGLFIIDKEKTITHYDPDGSISFCVNGSLCLAYLKNQGFQIPNQFKLVNTLINIENNSKMPSISFIVENYKHKKMEIDGIYGLYVEIDNPHFFIETQNISNHLLYQIGKKLVKNIFFKKGANISYILKITENKYKISTFERGLEKITECCGSACSAYSLYLAKTIKSNNTFEFIPPSDIPRYIYCIDKEIKITGDVCYVYQGKFIIDNNFLVSPIGSN